MYGFPHTITFGTASDLALAPSKVRHGTHLKGPEGLMVKAITNMAEAVQAGGLLIVSKAAGSTGDDWDWQFYVGSTLLEVLADLGLGLYASNDANQTESAAGYKSSKSTVTALGELGIGRYNAAAGEVDIKNNSTFYQINYTRAYAVTRPRPRLRQYWPSGAGLTFKAYAIVTGASSGYGHKFNKSWVASQSAAGVITKVADATRWGGAALTDKPEHYPVYSFMSTLVPMRTTFDAVARRGRQAAIDAAPKEVRSYYAATFEQALRPFAALRPEVCLTTVWKNGALSSTLPVVATARFPAKTSFEATEPSFSFGWHIEVPTGGSLATVYGAYSRMAGGMQNGWDTTLTVGNAENVYTPDLGMYASDSGLPMIDWTHQLGKQSATNVAGAVEDFAVGQVRDGHVVYRALVTGSRFAADTATHAKLVDYVNAHIVGDSAALAFQQYRLGSMTSEQLQAADLENLLPSLPADGRRVNAYDAGPIVYVTMAFLNEWDRLAKAMAEAA